MLDHCGGREVRAGFVVTRPGPVTPLRYKFRLDPTPGQRIALSRAFGCARVVFNDGLKLREEARRAGRPYVSNGDVQKAVITGAKKTPERAWLAEVSSVVLVQAVNDLHAAYRNFFESLAGKRRGRRVGAPRFRSRKNNRQTIRLTVNGFRLRADGALNIAKVGDIPVRWSRALPSSPTSVTVTLDPAGRYWASFVVGVARAPLPPIDREIGLDLGLTSFVATSDGELVDAPQHYRRAGRKLAIAQRALCRKKKGSANRKKAVRRVARIHAQVADTRSDWLHKLSTRLIRDNQAVYVEDLNVAGLGRTRLAKSIHDAGWSRFVGMLEYKAALYGRTFGRVDRWAPTSQICSDCGHRDGPKPLAVREWTCGMCGAVHDRDANAARNVLALGRRDSQNACGGGVRPLLVGAVASEAGTLRGVVA